VNTYQIIFQQGYEFITASKMLELIIQRIQEFIFVLYAKDKVYSIIIMDDRYKDLFNNNMHITLQEFELSKEDDMIFSFPIYARLRFKTALRYTILLASRAISFIQGISRLCL
jgi:hypothetical protein